jgi:hypothetical protein
MLRLPSIAVLPAIYAFPVVVAPPEIVRPLVCVPPPMVEEASEARPEVNLMSVEVAFAAVVPKVEGVNGNAAPDEPEGVVVAMMVPLPSTARKLPAGVASGAMVTLPVLEILKSVVVEFEVELATTKRLRLASPSLPLTESLAEGEVVPTPRLAPVKVKALTVGSLYEALKEAPLKVEATMLPPKLLAVR